VLLDPPPSHPAPPGALDETEKPDPRFWGREQGPRPRRRPAPGASRIPSPSERRGALIAVVAIAATVGLLSLQSSARSTPPSPTPARAAAATARPRRVVVHIAGAVTRPGVVDLPAGARVIDAVDAAGGALAAADLDRLNLAAPLRDGEQVLVPLTGSPTTTAPTP
jgi:competence protein ComEA